jgi:hypothetical protein
MIAILHAHRVSVPVMKSTTPKKVSVIKPLLKKLMNQHGANSKVPKQNSKAASAPLKPAELAQDSGAGYSSDNTFLQS